MKLHLSYQADISEVIPKILTARHRRGLTQRELASSLGRTQPWMNQLETGEMKSLSYADAKLLEEILNIQIIPEDFINDCINEAKKKLKR